MGKRSIAAMTAALVTGSLLTGLSGTSANADTPADARSARSDRLSGVDLDTVTIPQLQARMARGSLTSSALTRAYLRRIEKVDPKIHAVLRTSPTALREAAASDKRHRSGRTLGPLDGIPVLLKDNVNTRDMPTTAGSLALAGKPPGTDAALVTRLREAGAVILGKTNLSEWANFRAAKPTSGWSAVGGQTNNPYVLDRNPCGSSSGSAAALAASLAQVAIGTETDGSIVCPAGMNGVVGHKPSLGVVSRSGVVPISAEQDTAGPMARNVTDTALTLSVLSEDKDGSRDAARDGLGGGLHGDLRDGLRGKRIGLWRLPSLGPDVDALMTRTAEKLRKAGAVVVEVTPPYQARLAELEFPALLSEFHRDIDAYLATREGPRNLAELIEFNRAHPQEQSCFAGQELFEQALAAPPTTDPEYRAMRAELKDLSQRSLDETLSTHRLDAIAAPTNPPAWTTDCARGDNDVIPSSTPAAVAGYPSLSVPAGSVGELPVGLLLMSGNHRDAKLLELGASVEDRLNAWRAPHYLPTVDTAGTGR
ncbi:MULTISPECIES: amidase [Streptomyces]|uniref:Amidase n=1 Tax=Streptomyces venezuelae TaxID=54571 RepID=A0A5P2BKE8_STRVZ|nr:MULTISPECIES: amidase [Streptomyces]NDZ99392.1 amidase [Streptomyces sp. SID10116]MYY85279.1 amidase [Streptomyces sp. SID335]MYZ12987.1 amidase [Streptomyces sp. SID337]NDZ85260.1 amidase [Streptomyces sp. SID10115]NEB46897.1 amidase [Streptomyces sp. SID339]